MDRWRILDGRGRKGRDRERDLVALATALDPVEDGFGKLGLVGETLDQVGGVSEVIDRRPENDAHGGRDQAIRHHPVGK